MRAALTRRALIRARAREAGYVAVLTAIIVASFLIPITAIAVDVARWYVEVERVQNAADAAATAGVTYLPDDFATAKSTAITVAGRNGYPNTGETSVEVTLGGKPTQLKVTVSSTIRNSFAGYFDQEYATISRSAVADYNGPAPMGSPCNAFGNEPAAGNDSALRGPKASVIITPPGGAICSSNPQFWGAIAGPMTPKSNGDAYMTRKCSSGAATSCNTGTRVNPEFDPLGYFYLVRVGAGAVGTAVTMQIYDPAMVFVGDNCADGPKSGGTNGPAWRNNANPYTEDGIARYAGGVTGFCNGDTIGADADGVAVCPASNPPAGCHKGTDFVTSYVLRQPTDTYVPKNGAPMPSCARQYQGYHSESTFSKVLDSGQTSTYQANVAKVFRQWVTLCTFTPTQAGDHYLQIRTNVALGGTADGEGGYTGNDKVYTQAGDNTAVRGSGNNRFALRIKGTARSSISVAGWDRMGIYANYNGAVTQFNLVRVVPAAASKTLKIGFFDTGDAPSAGTLTIKPPTDSNLPTSIVGCVSGGEVVTTGTALPGCQLTNVKDSTGYQGKWQYVKVPIPPGYTCLYQQSGGCWFKVEFAFPGTAPTDTTTWTAKIEGDPIRLIE